MDWHLSADDTRSAAYSHPDPFDSPPAVRPCYICGQTVGLTEGWHRNGYHWCENHQPVWSRERLKCQAPHPDDKRVKCARRYGHAGDHAATTKGPQTQWWKPRESDERFQIMFRPSGDEKAEWLTIGWRWQSRETAERIAEVWRRDAGWFDYEIRDLHNDCEEPPSVDTIVGSCPVHGDRAEAALYDALKPMHDDLCEALDHLRQMSVSTDTTPALIESIEARRSAAVGLVARVERGLHGLRVDDYVETVRSGAAESRAAIGDWLTPFEGSGREWHESLSSPYTYQPSDFSKLVAAVHEYEAALLASREALHRCREDFHNKVAALMAEKAARVRELEAALSRAAHVAEHLHAMIDRDTWRSTGGDDGQGHYEGDYRAEVLQAEIVGWKEIARAR